MQRLYQGRVACASTAAFIHPTILIPFILAGVEGFDPPGEDLVEDF